MPFLRSLLIGLALALLSACQSAPAAAPLDQLSTITPIPLQLITATLPAPPTATVGPTPAPLWTPQSLPAGLHDALPLLSGVCFEAAYDAAGRAFVLRSAAELDAFYGLADRSGLCRRAVVRHPYDFSGGRVLVGTWTRGLGCTAGHELLAYERDDAARRIVLRWRFIAQGDCPYELVRPLWIGIDQASDYEIQLTVE